MLLQKFMFVKAGELLRSAVWNALGFTLRSLRLIAGDNVLLRWTPMGTIVNFVPTGEIFDHPWRPTLNGTDLIVNAGTINGVGAQMKDSEGTLTDLDQENDADVPLMDLSKPVLDESKRGYIAAEVTCDPKDWSVISVEVVQVADLDTEDGKPSPDGIEQESAGGAKNLTGRRARVALNVLRQDEDGSLRLIPAAHHNLKHRVRAGDLDADTLHFFYV